MATAIGGLLVFLTNSVAALALLFTAIIIFFLAAKIPARGIIKHIRPAIIMAIVLFVFHVIFSDDLILAGAVSLRVACLISFASLMTLTTKTSAMIDAFEAFLRIISAPLRVISIKINTKTISFMLSITIRFIPVLFHILQEVMEAQKARGCTIRSITGIKATVIPLMIRTLRTADELTDAIDARGYGS
jgi:biotin transport system permease protein